MKLDELIRRDILERPAGNRRSIADGAYKGTITFVELAERESKFSEDGSRVILNMKTEVEDDDGEIVDLYISPNYSWSKKGNMMKILEKLDALPAPGESISLEDLVGIPVQVIVENVEKDGETYSNIVSIKKIQERTPKKKPVVAPRKRPTPIKTYKNKNEIEEMFEDDLEDDNEIPELEDLNVDDLFEDDDE